MNIQEKAKIYGIADSILSLMQTLKRMGGEGCVAASGCADSEAVGTPVSAERAKPSIAAHVAAVKAEALEDLAGTWDLIARSSKEYHESTKNRRGERDTAYDYKGRAIAYREAAKDLRDRIAESRKANDAEEIKRGIANTDQSVKLL